MDVDAAVSHLEQLGLFVKQFPGTNPGNGFCTIVGAEGAINTKSLADPVGYTSAVRVPKAC